jgi:hypothetical protein
MSERVLTIFNNLFNSDLYIIKIPHEKFF